LVLFGVPECLAMAFINVGHDLARSGLDDSRPSGQVRVSHICSHTDTANTRWYYLVFLNALPWLSSTSAITWLAAALTTVTTPRRARDG
jgi:hypothetical protein